MIHTHKKGLFGQISLIKCQVHRLNKRYCSLLAHLSLNRKYIHISFSFFDKNCMHNKLFEWKHEKPITLKTAKTENI